MKGRDAFLRLTGTEIEHGWKRGNFVEQGKDIGILGTDGFGRGKYGRIRDFHAASFVGGSGKSGRYSIGVGRNGLWGIDAGARIRQFGAAQTRIERRTADLCKGIIPEQPGVIAAVGIHVELGLLDRQYCGLRGRHHDVRQLLIDVLPDHEQRERAA